mgnify:CR=1 FL=1
MPELRHTLAYRIILGAVLNTLHAHPEWKVSPSLPRSVAKRAAGTLLAHLASRALAAVPSRESCSQATEHGRKTEMLTSSVLGGLLCHGQAPFPLKKLQTELGRMAGEARHAGHTERCVALEDALRVVAKYCKAMT